MALGTPSQNKDPLVLAALFVLELSLIVMAMAMYMKGERPFAIFLSSNPGGVFLLAVAVVLVAGAVIVRQYLASKRAPSRHFRLIVTMNLVTVLLILITAEIALRIVTHSSPEDKLLGSVLLPRSWETVALHHRQLLDEAAGFLSYLVYDDLMGWTVGPNRQRTIGGHWPAPYWSSSEGIRAPHEGISFAQLEGKTRIALVGDSVTFADEVAYEDSWGDRLEKVLGSEFQVLNFGVTAYGVDQAYLRYEKDVRKWNPKIVILGLISDDLRRSLHIYGFLAFPARDIPFSKPRFLLRDGALTSVNAPPLTPDAIVSRPSISELPFLGYDRAYRQSDWEERLYHLSYLARLFVTRFTSWSAVSPDVSHEALVSVNAAILKAFVQSAEQAGIIPLLVYFPMKKELENSSVSLPAGKQVFQQSGLAYTDTTSCLLEVNPADRFVPSGRHYSPQGNAAVANCLLNVVRQSLAQAA